MTFTNLILTLTGRFPSARRVFIASAFWIVSVWAFSLFVQPLVSGFSTTDANHGRWSWRFLSIWDARRYQEIARDGYQNASSFAGITNFYPLYPLLMRAIAVPFSVLIPFPLAVTISGVSLSAFAFLWSIVLLLRLFRERTDEHTAVRAAIYMLVFPTAFFFLTVYTESLYLLLSIAMFSFIKRSRWILAGFVGGLASLTRPIGVMLLIPFLISFLSGERRHRSAAVVSVALFLCLYALLPIFMWIKFNDPWRYMTGVSAWGLYPPFSAHFVGENLRSEAQQLFSFLRTGPAGVYILIQHIASVLLGMAAAVWCWRRRLVAWSLYCAIGVLLPIATGDLFGEARYVLILFPVFLMLAREGRRPWIRRAFASTSLLFLLVNVIFVVVGAWVS